MKIINYNTKSTFIYLIIFIFLCIKQSFFSVQASPNPPVKSDPLGFGLIKLGLSTVQYLRKHDGYPETISIEISSDGDDWSEYSINSGRITEIYCDHYKFIKIETTSENETIQSSYDLSCQARYEVVWNSENNKWDINLLVAEK
ncbi:hypothetical protein [Myxosarcina sp. GI1(2024)]